MHGRDTGQNEDNIAVVGPGEDHHGGTDAAVQSDNHETDLQHFGEQHLGGEYTEYEDCIAPEDYEEDGADARVVNDGVEVSEKNIDRDGRHSINASAVEDVLHLFYTWCLSVRIAHGSSAGFSIEG